MERTCVSLGAFKVEVLRNLTPVALPVLVVRSTPPLRAAASSTSIIIPGYFHSLLLFTWFTQKGLIPISLSQLPSRKLTGQTTTMSWCSHCLTSSNGPKISRFCLERRIHRRFQTLEPVSHHDLLTISLNRTHPESQRCPCTGRSPRPYSPKNSRRMRTSLCPALRPASKRTFSYDVMLQSAKDAASRLRNQYSTHAKRLQRTGEGIQDEFEASAEVNELMVPACGPDHSTSSHARNIWGKSNACYQPT